MLRGTKWLEHLAIHAQLEDELLPGQSVVELLGDSRVLIERHKGVTVFSVDEICVRLKFGNLLVCGQGLQMEKMSNENLVITGRIDSMRILRR